MPAFGAPSYGGAPSGNGFNIPRPVDLVDNCYVILTARSQDTSGSTPWTPPAGFTRLTAVPVLPSSTYRVGDIWWKKIGLAADEPATYTLTGPGGRSVGMAVRFVPDTTGPLVSVGTSPYGGGAATGGIVTVPARTASDAPSLTLLALGAEVTEGISHVPSQLPAGFTAVGNAQSTLNASTSGSRTALWFGYRIDTTTAVGGFAAGFAGASAVAAYATSVKGGAVGPPQPQGIPVKLGSGAIGYLSYLDGSGVRKTPASLRMTQPPLLLAQSISVPGITMGHRGASVTPGMPEMSRRAYRYAATSRSYRMLEFSCNRTLDGVYVGVHDADLNRTSETTGLPNVSAMTWAQVQAYNNSLNSLGVPAPYTRLEDFLDEFARDAIVHVDPKSNTGGMGPFLDVLDAHGGPSRIVIKFVGTGPGAIAIAQASRARGYLAAGYFYEADWAAGTLAAEQSYWDILGIQYQAGVEAFSRGTEGAYPGIRSYGKPLVVHVINSPAAYAIAKGKVEEGGWLNGSPGRSWIAQISRPDTVAPVW